MKKICFSFDDGRIDTFLTAVPILEKYGYSATINITTDYLEHPEDYKEGSFRNRNPVSIADLANIVERGFELAGHGCQHKNTVSDINQGIEVMESWGLDVSNCGFASPYSFLRKNNIASLKRAGLDDRIMYIRSGIQVRREGILYSILYYLMEKLKSKWLFYVLNKSLIITEKDNDNFYLGITVTKKTTVGQIMRIIGHMPNKSALILIFHSILCSGDEGYGKDRWGWEKENFELLCEKLNQTPSIEVCNTKEMVLSLEE